MARIKHNSNSQRATVRRIEPEAQVERPVNTIAYAVLSHDAKELAIVTAANPSDALWQARQLEQVKVSVAKNGGLWLLPLARV